MAKKLSTQELHALAKPHLSETVTEVIATTDGCIFSKESEGHARAWANRNKLEVIKIKASEIESTDENDNSGEEKRGKKKGGK